MSLTSIVDNFGLICYFFRRNCFQLKLLKVRFVDKNVIPFTYILLVAADVKKLGQMQPKSVARQKG